MIYLVSKINYQENTYICYVKHNLELVELSFAELR